MNRIAYWAVVVSVGVLMFIAVQWATCWWTLIGEPGDSMQCAVETTKERFGYASQ